jgi:hypothetical protein
MRIVITLIGLLISAAALLAEHSQPVILTVGLLVMASASMVRQQPQRPKPRVRGEQPQPLPDSIQALPPHMRDPAMRARERYLADQGPLGLLGFLEAMDAIPAEPPTFDERGYSTDLAVRRKLTPDARKGAGRHLDKRYY